MKKLSPIALLLLFVFGAEAQIIYLLDQQKMESLYAMEDSLGSILHNDELEFGICRIPWKDPNCMKGTVKLKGKIYKRTNDDFEPTLHTWYFQFPNGNARHIKANWGLYNNSSSLTTEETIELFEDKEDDFVQKYESLKAELVTHLGKPSKREEIQDGETRLLKKVKWNSKDKYICLTMVYYRYNQDSNIPKYMPINTHVEIDIYYKSE